jgi:hypothetical protein
MEAEWAKYIADGNYFFNMDESQLAGLEDRVDACIPVLRGTSERKAILVLQFAGFYYGFHNAENKAFDLLEQKEAQEKAAQDELFKVHSERSSERAQMDSVVQDYDSLVKRYNGMVRKYNSLAADQNALIDSVQNYMKSMDRILSSRPPSSSAWYQPPSFVVPRPATQLSCTAIALPGNMASINCW